MLKELLKNTKLVSKVLKMIKENENEILDIILFGSLFRLFIHLLDIACNIRRFLRDLPVLIEGKIWKSLH